MVVRFEAADGIRGVACLIVLILHAVVIFYYGLNGYLTGMPKIGVWLFFVLSAFLLTSKFELDGFSQKSIASYLAGRIFRIIPLYLMFIFVYWHFGTAGINTNEDVIQSIFLSGAYSHLWTIPIEFKYYAILPLVSFALIYAKNKLGLTASLLLGVLVVAAQQYIWPYWQSPAITADVTWFLSCFAVGSMAAICMTTSRRFVTGARADFVAITAIFLMVITSPYIRLKLFGIPPDSYLLNKYVYFSVGCAVVTVFLSHGDGFSGAVMKSYPLRILGRWSYPVYLVHWLIIMKVAALYHGNPMAAFISVIISIGVGGGIHYAVERPIERFRHSLMRKITS